MTKHQVIDYVYSFDLETLDRQLQNLMDEGRITTGARYYVYNPYRIYTLTAINELVGKATKSKDYDRYIRRIKSTQYNVWLRMFDEDVAKIQKFISEQTRLPFAQTQKQQLIANGELSA